MGGPLMVFIWKFLENINWEKLFSYSEIKKFLKLSDLIKFNEESGKQLIHIVVHRIHIL